MIVLFNIGRRKNKLRREEERGEYRKWGDRRSESVNRSLTVSPRHAPLTRGLNIKPRPFLGWAARFLSLLLPGSVSLPFPLASSTRQRRRTEVRARPLLSRFSIGLSKQRLVLTFIAIIGVISAMWDVVRPRRATCSDCRRVVGWLHGAASSRDRDLLRKLVPLLLDRHRLRSLLPLPNLLCDWKEQFFSLRARLFFFAWWTGGTE